MAGAAVGIDLDNARHRATRRPSKKRTARDLSAARLNATFEELPLPFDRWVTEAMGLDHTYSTVQHEILRHAEQVYYPDMYPDLARTDLAWRAKRMVNELWLMVGKGGGKDHMAALTQLRLVYLLLCLRNPQRYFRIGATSDIHLINVATSEGHGLGVYRAEFKGLLAHSPWFQGLSSVPDDIAKETRFDKRIVCISGNSKEDSGEGYNVLSAVLDEIDAFRTKDELEQTARTARGKLLNADGIYKTLKFSAESRFPATYKLMGLSWPRFKGSFIWEHHHAGLKDFEERGNASRTYVIPSYFGATTWESNPTKSKDDYAESYRSDPETARARYECRPPASEAPYFRNEHAIDAGFAMPLPDGQEPLTIEYFWGLSDTVEQAENVYGESIRVPGVRPVSGWQTRFDFSPAFHCEDDAYPRAVHVDIGVKRDRCGVAMSHVRDWVWATVPEVDPETGAATGEDVEVARPLVTTDLVTWFEPPYDAEHGHGEVELRWVRALIFELLARGYPIKRVTFDGYQSTDSIQLLTSWGIEASLFSLDRSMVGYDTAKSVLYHGGHLSYPCPLLVRELKALTLLKGKKIDHPPGGSKDVADAWAGAVHGAIELAATSSAGDARSVWTPDPSLVPGDLARLEGRNTEQGVPQDGNLFTGLPPDLAGFSGIPFAS